MSTNLYDLSTPLLLAAKSLNAAALPALRPLKQGLFRGFAATFFVVRVLLPPLVINIPAWRNPGGVPALGYWVLNGCLSFIYLLQLVWFWRIIKIATAGDAATGGARQPATQQPAAQQPAAQQSLPLQPLLLPQPGSGGLAPAACGAESPPASPDATVLVSSASAELAAQGGNPGSRGAAAGGAHAAKVKAA